MDSDDESNYSSEYIYSDDDGSMDGGSDDGMDTASLEMEDDEGNGSSGGGGGRAKFSGGGGATASSQKRKSRSSDGGIYDCIMRDNESAIQMMDSKDILPMMKRRISEITEVFDIPSSAAGPLLRNHKWTKERLFESYTDNDAKVQKEAGVYARCTETANTKASATGNNVSGSGKGNNINIPDHKCAICFDDEFKADEMLGMPCGHEFCLECWAGFVTSKIGDGPSCIVMTCPQAGCSEIVTEEEVCKVVPKDQLDKFESYQLRNFVELNGTSRWCPGPGCERVAALNSSSGLFQDSDNIVAECDSCMTRFCIKCGEEPHSPLICSALETWKEKCKNESETANWILANTKACPKCRSRIEKNQGCNHMTCQKCKYEFCWICSGDWKEHGANTGGYYNCNKFNDKPSESDDGSDAAKAKRELDRYLHYYSRYHAHAEAQKFAKRQLLETEKRMVLLQEQRNSSTWADVEFLKTANEQLVECRRVLKYTFTFAYYLTMPPKSSAQKEDEPPVPSKKTKDSKKSKEKEEAAKVVVEAPKDPAEELRKMQKERFEHHQEMLERFTEALSELVEKPLDKIDRESVVNQTRVVDRFMKNMLQYVEDGMEEG